MSVPGVACIITAGKYWVKPLLSATWSGVDETTGVALITGFRPLANAICARGRTHKKKAGLRVGEAETHNAADLAHVCIWMKTVAVCCSPTKQHILHMFAFQASVGRSWLLICWMNSGRTPKDASFWQVVSVHHFFTCTFTVYRNHVACFSFVSHRVTEKPNQHWFWMGNMWNTYAEGWSYRWTWWLWPFRLFDTTG